MSYLIRKKVKNTTYLYEVTYYNENGKEKRKWSIKGKLDENGELIPSKKRNLEGLSVETKELPITATSENVKNESRSTEAAHQVSQEVVNVPVVLEENTQSEKTETIEAEIVDNNVQQVVSKKSSQYKFGISKVENVLFDEKKKSGNIRGQ